MTKKSTVYAIALLAGLCAAAISFFAPFFPYGSDSANYIEQARSVMTRGVFEVPRFRIGETDAAYVPDKLFPPGYPLIIVIGSLILQLPAEVIAPFLSLAALALLPLVIVFSFHRVLGLVPALWIGILVALSPAAVRHGYIAFSDTLSLVLVIYAVNRLVLAGDKHANWFWLGLLTGFSYLIRNANLALLLSICIYLLWCFIVEPENRKEYLKNGLIWLGANALIIVPWLIRNLLVFGKLQPYKMGPSTVSLGENSHDFLQALLDNLLAFSSLDKLLAGKLWGIVLLLVLVAVLVHQLITTWRRWQKTEQKTFFIALVYAALGAAITIAARTKYEWGQHIVPRYALPYSCFVFVALFIIFKNTAFKINTRYFGPGLAITLLLTRAYELPKLYEYSPYHQSILEEAKQIKANHELVCSNLDGKVMTSDRAFVYIILCPEPIRKVYNPDSTKQISH